MRVVDDKKIAEWMERNGQMRQSVETRGLEKSVRTDTFLLALLSGTFDPTPPVQPDTPDHAEKLKETSPCHPYAGSIQFPTTQPRDRPQRGDHIHPDTGRTC
jgi:hypothetical protein